MCGIIGVTGSDDAAAVVLRALEILEYRGYDSAGIAIVDGHTGGIWRQRAAERAKSLTVLGPLLVGAPVGAAIGHTRWATHGAPTEANAHPHLDCAGRVAVVHNGIIENHRELAAQLAERGHSLSSQTDTEVIAHLIEDHLADGFSLFASVRAAVRQLEGDFALAVVATDEPDVVISARRTSPLIIGMTHTVGVVGSDIAALLPVTRDLFLLGDDEVAEVRPGKITVTSARYPGLIPKLAFGAIALVVLALIEWRISPGILQSKPGAPAQPAPVLPANPAASTPSPNPPVARPNLPANPVAANPAPSASPIPAPTGPQPKGGSPVQPPGAPVIPPAVPPAGPSAPAPVSPGSNPKDLPGDIAAKPPDSPVKALANLRRVYIAPAPDKFDAVLRKELIDEFKGSVEFGSTLATADAVMTVALADEKGHRVSGAGGKRALLKGSQHAIATLRDPSAKATLWTADVDDRAAFGFGDRSKRMASRLASRLHKDMTK